MSSNPGLEVLIKSILDSKGFDELQAKMQAAKEQSKETGDSLANAGGGADAFKDALVDVAAGLGIAIGAAELAKKAFELFVESLDAAIEDSRLLNQMSAANEVLAGSSVKSREANEAWLRSVEDNTNVLKEQLIPSYLRLIAVTKDVETAQRLTQVAALAQKAGLGEVGEATQAMIRYMESGKTTTRGFGAVLKSLIGDAKDTATGMANVEKALTKLGAEVDNAGTKVDAAKVSWVHTKEAIGDLFIVLVNLLTPAMKLVAEGIGVLYAAVQGGLIAPFKTVIQVISGVSRALVDFIDGEYKKAWGDIKGIGTAVSDTWKKAEMDSQEFMKKMVSAWDKDTKDINTSTKTLKTPMVENKAAMKELMDAYDVLISKAKLSSAGQIDELLKVAAVYKQMSGDVRLSEKVRAEAEEKVKEAIIEVGKLLIKEHVAEQKRIDDEAAEVGKMETRKLLAYRKSVDERLKLAGKEVQAHGKYATQYLEDEISSYEAATHDFELEVDKRNEYAEKAAKLRIELAHTELQAQEEIATEGMNLLTEVFGQNKELAIAQAVINTYEGATKALSQGGIYGVVLAAIVIAAGLAQVAKIAESQPAKGGGGFDDPKNDFAAYVGGQKWAKDMVGQWTGGVASGFSGVMKDGGGSQTTNNNNTNNSTRTANYNIRMSGLFDSSSDIAMRRFARGLQVVNTLEGQRTLK